MSTLNILSDPNTPKDENKFISKYKNEDAIMPTDKYYVFLVDDVYQNFTILHNSYLSARHNRWRYSMQRVYDKNSEKGRYSCSIGTFNTAYEAKVFALNKRLMILKIQIDNDKAQVEKILAPNGNSYTEKTLAMNLGIYKKLMAWKIKNADLHPEYFV